MNTKNSRDNKDSLMLGNNAEKLFASIAKKKGFSVAKSTDYQDINNHYDFILNKGSNYKVDVKSRKRISRKDDSVQDELVWIELHGVRSYDDGWLYNGGSDFIAFERIDDFIIIRRTDLIKLVDKLVDFDKLVACSSDALYKVYNRKDRDDKLTLIKCGDLMTIEHKIWEKQNGS